MTNGPVICGIDDSSSAAGAIQVARELAERYRLPLLYVHVLDGREGARGSVQCRRAEVAVPAGGELATETGHPADGLVGVAADRHASFVVVGCHGPRTSLLGSVSAEVARRAPCPVVVVPPGAGSEAPRHAASELEIGGGIVRFGLGGAATRVA